MVWPANRPRVDRVAALPAGGWSLAWCSSHRAGYTGWRVGPSSAFGWCVFRGARASWLLAYGVCMDATGVVVYCRLSQDKTGLGLGVERQEQACREHAAARGWVVREVIVDNDVSATSGKHRPGFERLLGMGGGVVVLVWHVDRLVRLTRELERVIDAGLVVHAVQAGYLDLSTPTGRAMARTVAAWSQHEGDLRTERQLLQQAQRVESGGWWWSRRPFGFEMDGSLRGVEAGALADGYRWVLDGVSLTGVAERWNGLGLRTSAGSLWGCGSVRAVLRAPRNAGLLSHRGRVVGPAGHGVVVDRFLWDAVQRVFEGRVRGVGSGSGKTRNLLSRFGLCGVCGGGLVVGVRTGGGRIYRCAVGQHVSCSRDWLDGVVVGAVVSRLSAGCAAGVWVESGAGDGAVLRAEWEELQGRVEGLAVDYADGLLDRAAYRGAVERVRARMGVVEGELAVLSASDPLEGFVGVDVAGVWDGLGLVERRGVLGALFDGVVLLPRVRGVPREDRVFMVGRGGVVWG